MVKYRQLIVSPTKVAVESKRDQLRLRKARQLASLHKTSESFRSLNQREKDFITYMLVDNLDKKEAYSLSHNVDKPRTATVEKALQKPELQQAMTDAFDAAGVTLPTLVGVVAEGLDARHIEICKQTGEKTITNLPDHNTRFKFAELAFELRGETNKKGNVSVTQNNLTINVEGDDEIEDEFREILEKKYKKKKLPKAPVIEVETDN